MRSCTPNYVKELAIAMRKEPTPAEKKLWSRLRRKQLDGHRFYRQYPIGRFIADFYCAEVQLIIELDGSIHDTEKQRVYDELREKEIIGRGIRVVRYRNEQVLTDIDSVMDELSQLLMLLSKEAGRVVST